jgi:hypothetical protein
LLLQVSELNATYLKLADRILRSLAEIRQVPSIATQLVRIIAFEQQLQRIAQVEPLHLPQQRVAATLLPFCRLAASCSRATSTAI